VLFAFNQLLLTTPERYNSTTRREDVLPSVAKSRQASAFDANNHIRQSESMMALDVSAAVGGSLEGAAAAVTAKILMVGSTTDHMVTPGPALEFFTSAWSLRMASSLARHSNGPARV
jgi:homoserine acetyltransferase